MRNGSLSLLHRFPKKVKIRRESTTCKWKAKKMCISRSPFFDFRDGDILTDWIFQSREYWEFEEKANRQEGKMTFRCFFPWLSGHFWMSESSSFQSRFAYTAWLFETERDIGFVCDWKFAFRRMTVGRLFLDRMLKQILIDIFDMRAFDKLQQVGWADGIQFIVLFIFSRQSHFFRIGIRR